MRIYFIYNVVVCIIFGSWIFFIVKFINIKFFVKKIVVCEFNYSSVWCFIDVDGYVIIYYFIEFFWICVVMIFVESSCVKFFFYLCMGCYVVLF